ncbi:MAG: hypothetical protein AB7V50_02520, partial [Vampirovibrionia bacterium]
LMQRISSMPIWVKQAIYSELKSDIASCSDIELLDKMESKLIQLHVPKLSIASTRLIENNTLQKDDYITENQKLFIKASNEGLNLLEIAHKNNFSFKYTCQLFLDLVKHNYIEDLSNNYTRNFVLYIIGEIRLGEFLVRTGRLSTTQLDKALFTKKCSESFNSEITFREILVNLGYMKNSELESISIIKKSAEIAVSTIDETEIQSAQIDSMQDEIDSLLFQRKQLQEKIDLYKLELDQKNLEILEQTKQLEKYSKGFVGKFLGSLS